MKNILFIFIFVFLPLISNAQPLTKAVKPLVKNTQKGVTTSLTKFPPVVRAENLTPLALFNEGAIYATVMPETAAKTVLNYKTTYDIERNLAKKVLGTSQKLDLLSDPNASELLLSEIITIRNASLQNFLFNSLAEKDYELFLQDLSDYYSIPVEFVTTLELRFISPKNPEEVFANSVVNYMTRHPHKMNLKLREIMKNPLLDGELLGDRPLKEVLHEYISRPLTVQRQEEFSVFLKEAYKKHTKSLTLARKEAEATVAIYKDLLIRLQDFVARHGRVPAWSRGEEQERRLYNRLSIIMNHSTFNNFSAVLPYKQQIQAILEAYPKKYISLDETTDRLIAYVEQHGKMPKYPQDETQLTYAEDLFLESVYYWYTNNSDFRSFFCYLQDPTYDPQGQLKRLQEISF